MRCQVCGILTSIARSWTIKTWQLFSIPHLKLGFEKFSTFLLTSGSWQSLEISGNAGFSVAFYSLDAFCQRHKAVPCECPNQQA